jgi:hypothetical protein
MYVNASALDISGKLNEADYIQEPFRVLMEYPHAEEILGKNIKKRNLNLSDPFNGKNDDFAQVHLYLFVCLFA